MTDENETSTPLDENETSTPLDENETSTPLDEINTIAGEILELVYAHQMAVKLMDRNRAEDYPVLSEDDAAASQKECTRIRTRVDEFVQIATTAIEEAQAAKAELAAALAEIDAANIRKGNANVLGRSTL